MLPQPGVSLQMEVFPDGEQFVRSVLLYIRHALQLCMVWAAAFCACWLPLSMLHWCQYLHSRLCHLAFWDILCCDSLASTAGVIATPNSLHAGLYNLHGITREMVLKVAEAAGIPTEKRPFSLMDVYSADEAFATGTFGGLTAVSQVDGRSIGAGETPGPITKQLQALYQDAVAADVAMRWTDFEHADGFVHSANDVAIHDAV
jgi:Amino-transferase class IV